MPGRFLSARWIFAPAILAALSIFPAGAQGDGISLPRAFGAAETLHYSIEWRLITAGTADLKIEPRDGEAGRQWRTSVHVQSAGLVSKLYKLDDKYTSNLEDQFCATSSEMDTFERKKRLDTKVVYDRARGHASYVERDLVKNTTVSTREIQVPSCVSDVIGGLYKLRTMRLEPGQSVQIPTSDGKKSAPVRIEAQEREEISNQLGKFKTIRYEAFIFNGVIYSRRASMLVWLTDDERRLPVQIRARMSFPIGSITLSLEKVERQ